jgi:hypothetical protein
MKALTFTICILFAIQASGQFAPPNFVAYDLWDPDDMRCVDLDGDGDNDVLQVQGETTLGFSRLVWFDNLGGGDFGQAYEIARNAEGYRRVSILDLDDDGDVDIIVPVIGDDEVLWFENLGTGRLWNEHLIAIGVDGPYHTSMADLDNDGDQDVLTASYLDNKIAWFENLGNGNFSAQNILSENAMSARCVVAADVDNDGWLDVLSASRDDGKIALYRNQTGGIFSSEEVLTDQATNTRSVIATDVDNDGDVDAVWSSSGDHWTSWQANDGDGNFGDPIMLTDYWQPLGLVDMDNDGDEDILFLNGHVESVRWLENLGNGEFIEQQHTQGQNVNANRLTAGDLDGDGLPEIVAPIDGWTFGGHTVAYQNIGNGQFSGQKLLGYRTFDSQSVVTFDVDGDEDNDIVLISCDGYANSQLDWIYWHENLGNGVFGGRQVIDHFGRAPTAMSCADFDGDGDTDFVISAELWADVRVYDNTGGGTFEAFDIADWPNDIYGRQVTTGDLNGDNQPDVITCGEWIEWYHYYGVPDTLWIPHFIDDQIDSHWVSTGDLDGDDDIDLLVTSEDEGIFWYPNQGGGGMGAPIFITQEDTARSAIVADLNSDGLPDVLSKWTDYTIRWYPNLGGGVFGPEEIISDDAGWGFDVSASDIDGDGDLDVLGGGTENYLVWYENLGDGVFGPQAIVDAGFHDIRRVFTSDVDGDMDLDVVFSSQERVGWCPSLMNDIQGCTNIQACNYDSAANYDDGTCFFDPCVNIADTNNDGVIDTIDLLDLLGGLGCVEPPDCPGDLNDDGVVNIFDLLILLGWFGTEYP